MWLNNIAKSSIDILYSIVQYLYFIFTYNTAKRRCDLDRLFIIQIWLIPLTEYEFNAKPIFQHPMSLTPCTLWSSAMMYNVTSLHANWTINNTSLIIPSPRLKETCEAEYMSAFL